MKLLIVLRHGLQREDECLCDEGRATMTTLAAKLDAMVRGMTRVILTSPAGRAEESAKIIGHALEVLPEVRRDLLVDDDQQAHCEDVLALVRENEHRADVLLLVTHFEYALDFPSFYARQSRMRAVRRHKLGNAEAWVLDCEAQTVTHVTHK